MFRLLLAVIFVLVLFTMHMRKPAVRHMPGERAYSAPQQADLSGAAPFMFGKHHVTPLASYNLTAVVISTTTYSFTREADISPIDFAVGWGPMSDQSVLDDFHFTHGGRFLTYRCGDGKLALDCDEINSHSANMHLIPATDEIAAELKSTRAGALATLSGYLVRVDDDDRWHWVSSMSRTDKGNGACELMWVDRFSATQ